MRDVRVASIASIITLGVLALVSVSFSPVTHSAAGVLTVSFLDVGQGDAIFVESPSGAQVLVDGGKDGKVLTALGEVLGFFDRDLDMIVATHPDADHIGGLIDVLARYEVAHVLMTENVNDTPVYHAFVRAVEEEGAEVHYARVGQVYALGEGDAGAASLQILFPVYDPTNMESNASSIIARLAYGNTAYLLTGDSPKSIEEYLVKTLGSALRSDVLKVGHHGSRTSTAETFVTAVAPTYAIISAGKNNSYGHPHPDVTATLANAGVVQMSTAESGTLTSHSDGTDVWFE